MEAILLVGGKGTRLAARWPDRPKPLVPILGRPFLYWQLKLLARAGFTRVLLALGHRAAEIEAALADWRLELDCRAIREPEPLGTGGALLHALPHASTSAVAVLNGDSHCPVDYAALAERHRGHGGLGTLVVCAAAERSAYGALELFADGRVRAFAEKRADAGPGWVNAGVYVFDRDRLLERERPRPCSLEQELLPAWVDAGLYAMVSPGPLLDIGTGERWMNAAEQPPSAFLELALEQARARVNASAALLGALHERAVPQTLAAARRLAEVLRRGGTLLICGNGGSAADAQHIAAELVGRIRPTPPRPGLAAIALGADGALLTALGNDFGFERIYARQVEALGRSGDALLALSTSGTSPNVLAALEVARARGLCTVALGGAGTPMMHRADLPIEIPARDTPSIQEAGIVLYHLLCEQIEAWLAA